MASKNDVIAYFKDKFVEAGYRIVVEYDKDKICLFAETEKYISPKVCSKSELFAYSKLFYYIFIQKILKNKFKRLDKS
jgi:hypothetical protein